MIESIYVNSLTGTTDVPKILAANISSDGRSEKSVESKTICCGRKAVDVAFIYNEPSCSWPLPL